ncbi:uncharacterized protein LOC115891153 isoform X2 [Sitophilus oryzae]|uniref:Uncharacterized protein LOC115891153 isoform X2 n=1 Tax=Sitophilus oryzae TaxID=7048 RepID=A0A6J2YW60_SITOR|nr:uncharacterized protein LOC115891153 isoform X2 [Sitophilus oryzae]
MSEVRSQNNDVFVYSHNKSKCYLRNDCPYWNILYKKHQGTRIRSEYISDLRACRDVCSTWREKAEEILLKRTAPSWFTCYKVGSKGRKGNIIAHSSNLNYNNVGLGIILYDNYRIKLNKYICLHNNIVELTRKSVPEYLEEELVPKSVDYCLLSVPRVVSHFNNDRSVKDIQHHGSIFDGIFIPKIPSVRTVMFHCNPSKKREVEDAVQKYIKKNEQVKCALLFCKTQLLESLYTFLEYIIPKNKPRTVALGGGVIRGTKTFQQINPDKKIYTAKDVVCILFLKDTTADIHNFNAYSCVIRGNDLSKEEFNAELEEFRSNIILKNHSLGFRICCSAKYQETELDSFEEIFPQIPLLGLDAYGEIGWNSYPNANLQNEPQKTKRLKRSTVLPIAENIFSTIFILITWD